MSSPEVYCLDPYGTVPHPLEERLLCLCGWSIVGLIPATDGCPEGRPRQARLLEKAEADP